ncbi:hypothetical protein EON63_05520 [archaeon]|nr:MAG: hypothetical protein EON63_05520 [archaeon]
MCLLIACVCTSAVLLPYVYISFCRFLVDMRGEDVTSTQLRDDLMTMLVAGRWINVYVMS